MTETSSDYYGDNFKRNSSEAKNTENGTGSEHGGETQESSLANQRANEYVKELLGEKLSLDHQKQPNCMRLIEQEVMKTQQLGRVPPRDNKFVDIYREKPIKASVKVLVPVREHPKFNFVGKLLGPKGNSLKRLQEETMCKMAVLGRGSMRDRQKEEELRQSLDPKYSHLMEDLHVEISALGPPAEAYARLAFALAEVRKYLIPDSNDNIRQEQMREMEIIGETSHNEERPPKKSMFPTLKSGPGPKAPPRTATRAPVATPRVMPAKTKILSILDRARIAMEESYGGYDERDRYPSPPSEYEYSRYVDRYDDYDDYYPRGGVPPYVAEPPPRAWKPSYKSSAGSSNPRHSESSRYRTSPYSRPPK